MASIAISPGSLVRRFLNGERQKTGPGLPAAPYLPGEPRLAASVWEKENARRLCWLALTVVLLGLAWRFSRYLLRFPVWGDEAMLLINYINRGYLDMLGPIDNCQVAPLFFHWIELTAIRFLGADEPSLRLGPFLAGLANLALFWRLAHLTLPPLARTIAVGILAVSIWPVSMGTLTKPYAGDLFFSLVFLTAAVSWLRRPWRRIYLGVLAGVAPAAVLASYPSVFIGGAVSLALAPTVWRLRDRKAMTLFALYNLLLVGAFTIHYLFVSMSHLHSPVEGVTTAEGMQRYWSEGFPPLAPVEFLQWFFLANTGQMAAYPVGSVKGGSLLTVVLALVGLRYCWQSGQRGLVLLVAGSLGLGFLAALLRRYPYGTSCRLAQHLAPFYCLLAGLGASVLIQRLRNASLRWTMTLVVAGLLVLVGVVGMVRDFTRPYRDENAVWARQVVGNLMARAGDNPIVTVQDLARIPPVFRWHLVRQGSQVMSASSVDWQRLGREHSSLWVFSFGVESVAEQAPFQALLARTGRRWRCAERTPSILVQPRMDQGCFHCCVYHWVCDQPPRRSSELGDGQE